jgi:hypothetical protein
MRLSFKNHLNLLNKNKTKIHLPYIFNFKSKKLLFKIVINNVDQMREQIKQLYIRVETNNEGFLYFFLYLKIFLFILSVASFFNYQKKYYI